MMIPVIDDGFGCGDGDDSSWSSDTNRLLKTVTDESQEDLEALLSKGIPVNGHGGAFHETPLHLAAQQGWSSGLKLLLTKGANAHSVNQFGQTPMHYASASKAADCVRSLLEHGGQTTLDHRDMRGHTPLHDAATVGFAEGVVLLLNAGANVNVRDKKEETPLHKASKAQCVSSIIALLNKGADMAARDKAGESVLSYILRHLPAGLDAILDHSLIPDGKKLTSKKLEVTLNFIPLGGTSEFNQMKTLSDVVEFGYPKLLLHPVCEAFLLLKWHNVRKLFFIEVIFYFVYAILATILILDKFVWQRVSGTIPEVLPVKLHKSLQIIIYCQSTAMLLKQILTLIQGFRIWLLSFWNILNTVVPILGLMVLPGPQTLWQHHFATVALLLIWVLSMLHIGRFPGCGIYVAMFTRVAKVFVRIFLIFFCLLLAFSLSFFVSKYGHQYQVPSGTNINVTDKVYSDPSMTFMKTLTMMIGELDFDSAFVEQLRDVPGTSHIIYLAFVILVSIILANLLVALAVNDVQGLRNSAHLERLIKQMELVSQIEKTFSSLWQFSKFINFSCVQKRIQTFVHNFTAIKIFVQPYHPQKSSSMIVVEDGLIKEINLRQNHVLKMMECLRVREEASVIPDGRKLSSKNSRAVLSEYASFANCEDDLCDALKAIERNVLNVLGTKMEDVSSSLNFISTRLRVLEDVVFKDHPSTSDSRPVSPNRKLSTANHMYNPSIKRLHPKSNLSVAETKPKSNLLVGETNLRSNLSAGETKPKSNLSIAETRPKQYLGVSQHQHLLQRHSYPNDLSDELPSVRVQDLANNDNQNHTDEMVQVEMTPQRTVSFPGTNGGPSQEIDIV